MRGPHVILAPIALAAMTAACSVTWPEHRGGGAAEISATPHPVSLVQAAAYGEQALQVQHARCLRRLEAAVEGGALRWAAAELVLAERLALRAGRQIAAGLEGPAAQDLIALRERIERIENAIARAAKPRDGVEL